MKGFKTLLWLEARRSVVWVLALIGSLAFWAWAIYQVRGVEPGESGAAYVALLSIACAIGALVLAMMIARLRGESRGGQFQVLLLTPPSGAAHIAARFAFTLGTAVVYYTAVGALVCWAFALYGVPMDGGSAAELVVALPLYAVGVAIAPLLAWTLLLVVFISAYRVSGTGWIPGAVMAVGTPFALSWLFEGLSRVAYALPSWPVLRRLDLAGVATGEDEAQAFVDGVLRLPQEPLWIMLALTFVLLAVASRIWREVEA